MAGDGTNLMEIYSYLLLRKLLREVALKIMPPNILFWSTILVVDVCTVALIFFTFY